MGRRRNPAAMSGGPQNWVLGRAAEIVSRHEQLTIEGWGKDSGGAPDAQIRQQRLRDEFNTRRAKAEIVVALVTIAVQAIPTGTTVDWVVQQALWINGVRVRHGAVIVAAIIAGYELVLDDRVCGVGLRRPGGA
jgi:hypothetical protein